MCPDLPQELARLHKLVSSFIEEQFKSLRLKDDEEYQYRLVKLVGNTLLPEESMLIGFLPLMSYFTSKKDVKAGTKCPPEHEDLIRCLILRDALEKIGCTFENYSMADRIAKKKPANEEESKDIFDQLDNLADDEDYN